MCSLKNASDLKLLYFYREKYWYLYTKKFWNLKAQNLYKSISDYAFLPQTYIKLHILILALYFDDIKISADDIRELFLSFTTWLYIMSPIGVCRTKNFPLIIDPPKFADHHTGKASDIDPLSLSLSLSAPTHRIWLMMLLLLFLILT